MQEQNTPRTANDVMKDHKQEFDEKEAAKWFFSRPMDDKGYTGAYERYHTQHESTASSAVKLSEEKKREIRERVAKTLAQRMTDLEGAPIPEPAKAEKPEEKPMQPPIEQPRQPEPTENVQQAAAAPVDKQEAPSEKQEVTAAPAETPQTDKRGIVTGECEGEPFSFTDFKIKRANAVKEFFNNMHEFTFTRTNHEAVEMLHMHQPKEKEPSAEPKQNNAPTAAEISKNWGASALKERAENLYHIIVGERQMTLLRLLVTAGLFLLSLLFLTVRAADGAVSLCGIELPARIIAAIQMLVLLLGTVASFNLYVGTWQLIKNRRFGKEIVVCVIYTAGLLFGLFAVILPSVLMKEYYTAYTPWYLLSALVYHFGMWLQMNRLKKQFEQTVADGGTLQFSIEPLQNRFLLQNLDVGRKDDSLVVKQVKADMLSGFEEHGFAPDWFDKLSKVFVIALTAIAVIAGVGAWILSGDAVKAMFVFTGTFAFCSPFAAMYAGELPLYALSKEQKEIRKTSGQQFTVLHADAAQTMADAGAVIIGSESLFPAESVVLHGLRSAAGVRVDEAILDAVSILTAGKSILAPTFLQMISDKKELLKPVDSLTYEDGMGISAWVDDNRVLIGSRKLMENHNIRMPAKEIEHAESGKGRMILYLARRGELITAFSVSLQVLPQVKRLIGQARNQGVHLYIKTVDCLIENNLSLLFGEDADIIGILPSRLHADYDKETMRSDHALSLVLSDGSAFSALHTVLQLKRLRAALELNRLLIVILMAVTGIFFAAAAMAGNPVLTASLAVLIPVALHAAFLIPRR